MSPVVTSAKCSESKSPRAQLEALGLGDARLGRGAGEALRALRPRAERGGRGAAHPPARTNRQRGGPAQDQTQFRRRQGQSLGVIGLAFSRRRPPRLVSVCVAPGTEEVVQRQDSSTSTDSYLQSAAFWGYQSVV